LSRQSSPAPGVIRLSADENKNGRDAKVWRCSIHRLPAGIFAGTECSQGNGLQSPFALDGGDFHASCTVILAVARIRPTRYRNIPGPAVANQQVDAPIAAAFSQEHGGRPDGVSQPPPRRHRFFIENGFNEVQALMDPADSKRSAPVLQACASARPRDEHRAGAQRPAAIQMQSVEFAELAPALPFDSIRSRPPGRPFARRI